MAQESGTTRPYLEYLESQPRWEDPKRGWFPGMGSTPKPPRNTNFDGYLAKRRDRS